MERVFLPTDPESLVRDRVKNQYPVWADCSAWISAWSSVRSFIQVKRVIKSLPDVLMASIYIERQGDTQLNCGERIRNIDRVVVVCEISEVKVISEGDGLTFAAIESKPTLFCYIKIRGTGYGPNRATISYFVLVVCWSGVIIHQTGGNPSSVLPNAVSPIQLESRACLHNGNGQHEGYDQRNKDALAGSPRYIVLLQRNIYHFLSRFTPKIRGDIRVTSISHRRSLLLKA